MWGAVLASAAANKAASIGIGLSVLIGGAGTAEITGIGPAVRDIARPAAVETSVDADADAITEELVDAIENQETPLAATEDETASLELAVEGDEDAVDEENNREHFVAAADGGSGNLVWHQKAGAFHLRGVLVEEGGTLVVRTAGPDGGFIDLEVDAEAVDLHIPGGQANRASDDPAIEDFVGHLVRATGECADQPDAAAEPICTIREIRTLGNAGQPNDEDEATLDQTASSSTENDDASDESELEDEDTEDTDTQTAEGNSHGKPDHAGGPKRQNPSDE